MYGGRAVSKIVEVSSNGNTFFPSTFVVAKNQVNGEYVKGVFEEG